VAELEGLKSALRAEGLKAVATAENDNKVIKENLIFYLVVKNNGRDVPNPRMIKMQNRNLRQYPIKRKIVQRTINLICGEEKKCVVMGG
jgi:hypothetical protein